MPATIDILLVEDNPGDVRLAQETLKDYKLQNALHVVHDGEQALSFLRRETPFENARTPDLILLDIHLPRVDGLEVMQEMQKDPYLKQIPVVILTASRLDEELLRPSHVPTSCFIQKPLTLERYLDAVRCFPHLGLSIVKIAAV